MRKLLLILALLAPLCAEGRRLPEPPPAKVPPMPMDLRWNGPADTLTLFVIGDIMSHGAVRKSAEQYGYKTFFKYIEGQIRDADLAVGNMEFPLAGKPYSGYPAFSGPDSYAAYLDEVGFDVLLTANNHILDKGTAGMRRTIRRLEEMDIPYTGIARDAASDTLVNPLPVLVKGVRIALVNFTYGTEKGTSVRWPKVNYMDRKRLAPIMERARETADFVIVFPHWGVEYAHFHDAEQESFARWLVAEGADAIVGGHPHVIQDVQWIDGVPVIYSLGNALSNQNDLPARFEAALTLRIVHRFGEPLRLLPPAFDYLWCTKPGMVEDSYSAVPITAPSSLWRVPEDYRNMVRTRDDLQAKGLL